MDTLLKSYVVGDTSCLLVPNIFLSTLFSNILSVCSLRLEAKLRIHTQEHTMTLCTFTNPDTDIRGQSS